MGTYTLTETQPMGYLDGQDSVGTAGGADGTLSGADTIVTIGHDATQPSTEYNFGELKRTAGVSLTKYTNTLDANTPTGPSIATGGSVAWTYVVTNTGNPSAAVEHR